MKTLVQATHTGVSPNGTQGCFTRWANKGKCVGERTAAWLNSLGDDCCVYCDITTPPITVGQLRQNWLAWEANAHIAAVRRAAK
jgi:hypothetical protein